MNIIKLIYDSDISCSNFLQVQDIWAMHTVYSAEASITFYLMCSLGVVNYNNNDKAFNVCHRSSCLFRGAE